MRSVWKRLGGVVLAGLLLTGAGCAGAKPEETAPVAPTSVRTVDAALLNLLECPSMTCSVVEDLHAGDKVAVLTSDINGWLRVRAVASGREGYVLSRFVSR